MGGSGASERCSSTSSADDARSRSTSTICERVGARARETACQCGDGQSLIALAAPHLEGRRLQRARGAAARPGGTCPPSERCAKDCRRTGERGPGSRRVCWSAGGRSDRAAAPIAAAAAVSAARGPLNAQVRKGAELKEPGRGHAKDLARAARARRRGGGLRLGRRRGRRHAGGRAEHGPGDLRRHARPRVAHHAAVGVLRHAIGARQHAERGLQRLPAPQQPLGELGARVALPRGGTRAGTVCADAVGRV